MRRNNTSGKAINIIILQIFLVQLIIVKQTNKNVFIFFGYHLNYYIDVLLSSLLSHKFIFEKFPKC